MSFKVKWQKSLLVSVFFGVSVALISLVPLTTPLDFQHQWAIAVQQYSPCTHNRNYGSIGGPNMSFRATEI